MKREPPLFLVAVLIAALAVGIHVYSTHAQTEKRQKIRALLELEGADALSSQVLDQMFASLKSVPNLPPGFIERFREEARPTDLIDRVIPVYARYFSDSDLEAMIAFYQTPAGRRLIEVQPKLLAECMKIGEKWGREAAERAMKSLGPKQIVIPWTNLTRPSGTR